MLLVIIVFVGIFLLIAGTGILVFQNESLAQRVFAVINRRTQEKKRATPMESASATLSKVVEKLERVIPKSQAEISVVQQRLIRAGFRSDNAVNVFYGSKALVVLILVVAVTVTGIAKENPVIFYVLALGVGYLAPDFWLGRVISKRQAKIRLGLPDVLDLLVICVEAGLTLDQALARTVQELSESHPAIADEFGIVVLEQRAGRSRADAWRHVAERTDVDVVRNVVSMLIQSEQFGTSIAKILRTHSDTMRTQRIQAVEEMAAKTTIKLIFPLVFFIFPCLFVVTIGPAAILMMESFKENLTH
jgi:tight adherence protein C